MRVSPTVKDKSTPRDEQGLWLYKCWLDGSYHSVRARTSVEAYKKAKRNQSGLCTIHY